jgi:hypothetical protein
MHLERSLAIRDELRRERAIIGMQSEEYPSYDKRRSCDARLPDPAAL